MPERFFNDPSTTLNGSMTNSQTTLVVASATGFPTTGPFRILIESELMIVTSISGTTFTVTRGAESTSAVTHATSLSIRHVVTGGALTAAFTPTPIVYPINSNFSWVNQGSAAISTLGNGLLLDCGNSSSTDIRMRVKSLPTPPYTIEFCFTPFINAANSSQCGIVLRTSSSGLLQTSSITSSSGSPVSSIDSWNSATSYNTTAANTGFYVLSQTIYIQIVDNNTNRIWSYSADGEYWLQLLSVSRTSFLTPDQVGFFVNSNGSGLIPKLILKSYREY